MRKVNDIFNVNSNFKSGSLKSLQSGQINMKRISSSQTFKWHMGQMHFETGWGGLLNLPNSMVI